MAINLPTLGVMTEPASSTTATTNTMAQAVPRDMHTRYKLCRDLLPRQKCFRVQRYSQGKIEEVFHEHVPSHRISLDAEIEVLRALVDHCGGWPATFILHSRLNNRRGGVSRYPGFVAHVEYPEEGLIRRSFSSGEATAWSDAVIAPGSFRQQVAGRRSHRSRRRT
jgi:hypothetical protein